MTDPSNPFRALRLRKGLTLNAVSVRAKVSRYLVIRLEQGCFPDPPPRLLDWWVTHQGASEAALREDYRAFQLFTRSKNSRLFGDLPVGVLANAAQHRALKSPVPPSHYPDDRHPFIWLRTRPGYEFNLTEVSKMLCVAQPVLYHFEHYPRNQRSVPAQLTAALKDADYLEGEIEAFIDAYDDYRKFLRYRPKSLAS